MSYSALAQKNTQATYAKSDFVPGDVIFFEDTFENEKLGEFPSQWDLLDGYAEKYQEQPPGLQGNHLQPLFGIERTLDPHTAGTQAAVLATSLIRLGPGSALAQLAIGIVGDVVAIHAAVGDLPESVTLDIPGIAHDHNIADIGIGGLGYLEGLGLKGSIKGSGLRHRTTLDVLRGILLYRSLHAHSVNPGEIVEVPVPVAALLPSFLQH